MAEDKLRADVLLFELGLAESREKAQRLILAGKARIGADRIAKPSTMLAREANVSVVQPFPFVGRGALKILKALDKFCVNPEGMVCLDIGASTGGFTDALLSRGAAFVYAVDSGYGQMAEKLRRDARVCVMERVNARYVTRDMFPKVNGIVPTLCVMDVSFISITLIISAVFEVLGDDGRLLALVKPQFEAGRGQVGKGGIVRSEADHARILSQVACRLDALGFCVNQMTHSPIKGQTGNIEFLFDISKRDEYKVTNESEYAIILGKWKERELGVINSCVRVAHEVFSRDE